MELLSIIETEYIPSDLKKLITKEEVQRYNSLVEESNEKIAEYNSKIDIYRRVQEIGLECSVSLYNAVTCKATNIFNNPYD